ncbi:hypothetical protein ABFS82_03G017900 [Erythranthe guttata]|uniref:Knottin scorpion toxin-like domain-containing protein n=1 Tax=Erythranthe guttata TaxID=4155 RepID=A0A022QZE1_ERYGU|nr:hypothetical protein MIMGU_mgv1a017383mg [Erythranthe guttata]
MKTSLRLVVLVFLVVLCRGENENKAKNCSQQIFLGNPGVVCSANLCPPLCQKALQGKVFVRADCTASDIITCNCIYRC